MQRDPLAEHGYAIIEPRGEYTKKTTPPATQRQWVELTDEEIKSADCLEWHGDVAAFVTTSSITRFAKTIEAKLREKNGF